MNNPPPAVLLFPELILMSDHRNNFELYFDAVYEAFREDFVHDKPVFRGVKLRLKAIPYVDGRECTFYHITHTGNIETERIPDFRRMERIKYSAFMINNSVHPTLKVWENKRGKDERVLIFDENEGFLVVLSKRKDKLVLWTAYYIEQNHRRRKLIAEYNAYINTNAAQ